jgi:hypothetical protein
MLRTGSTAQAEMAEARRQSFVEPPDERATHNFPWQLSSYLYDTSDLLRKHFRDDKAEESPNAIELALRPEPTAEGVEVQEHKLFAKREREFHELSRRWLVNIAADCPTYLRDAEERVKFDRLQRLELEKSRRDAAMILGISGRYLDRKSDRIFQAEKLHMEQ